MSKLSSEVSMCGGYLGKKLLVAMANANSLECGRRKETDVLAVKKRRTEVDRELRGPSRPVKKNFGFCSE